MNELAVTDSDIIGEHKLAQSNAQSAVEHAVNCGRMLNERRPDFAHGTWMPWLKSIGMPQPTANEYMKAAKAATDSKLLESSNLTLGALLGEEKKTREKKVNPKTKVAWTKIAIEYGLMSVSAGGQTRKRLKEKLVEAEPSLTFPNGGLDRAGQLKMIAACENLSAINGVEEKPTEDVSKREIGRREIEIERRVQERVTHELQVMLDMYNEENAKHKRIIAAYKGAMTAKEYKMVSGALHSDRYPSLDDVMRSRMDRAFGIIRDRKLELCGEQKEKLSTLPKTVADLMAMKIKKTESRKEA